MSLSSEQLKIICYSIFAKRGFVLANRLGKSSSKRQMPEYRNYYNHSDAYHLSLRHLVLGRHLFSQYSNPSAKIQAKAFILATGIKIGGAYAESFIEELAENLLKDSKVMAESTYHSEKSIFFLALDIYSLYVYVLKIAEKHNHEINIYVFQDTFFRDGFIEHWVPAPVLEAERFKRDSLTLCGPYSAFESGFLRLVSSLPMQKNLVLLNYHRKATKEHRPFKEILDNAAEITVGFNGRIALLYIILSFMAYIVLSINYLESNISILSLGILAMLHFGCIISVINEFNQFKTISAEEIRERFPNIIGTYLNPGNSDYWVAVIHLFVDFLTTRHYLVYSLPFFYILRTITENIKSGPREMFDSMLPNRHGPKRSRNDSRSLAKQKPDAIDESPGLETQQKFPLFSFVKDSDAARQTTEKMPKIKTRPAQSGCEGLSDTIAADEQQSDCIKWRVANQAYFYTEDPVEQNDLDSKGINRNVYPIFSDSRLRFFAAFDHASEYANESEAMTKATKVLERGIIVGPRGQQGVKRIEGGKYGGQYEIKILGASGDCRYVEQTQVRGEDGMTLKLFNAEKLSHKDLSRGTQSLRKNN